MLYTDCVDSMFSLILHKEEEEEGEGGKNK